jgi:hypothetical protein
MGLRYAAFLFCEKCQRGTGHTKAGACSVCRGRQRRATRRAKSSAQGSNLARFGDVRKIADDLWSVWVRAAHERCEMCDAPFRPEAMDCAHGFSRAERAIRFDPTNTFALCSADHLRHTPPRQAWWDWMREYLGSGAYERLAYLSRIGGKFGLSDCHLVILDARQRIAALPEDERKAWARGREAAILERMVRLGVRMTMNEHLPGGPERWQVAR